MFDSASPIPRLSPAASCTLGRIKAARTAELALTHAAAGEKGLLYRELLMWVLGEYADGQVASLKRCYLSLPFAAKNLRKAVVHLEQRGYLLGVVAAGDRRKTCLLPTPRLLELVETLPP